jgi:hypothetical protein
MLWPSILVTMIMVKLWPSCSRKKPGSK